MKRVLVILTAAVLLACTMAGCGKNPSEEGIELLKQKKYEEAAGQFQEAVDKDKNRKDAYRGLGIARWELGDYEGAKKAFSNALKEGADKTAMLYNFIGSCEMQLDNPQGALNNYRLGMAVKDCGKELMQEMRFNEIAAYEKLQDWESARAKLDSYTADYPDDARAAKEAEFLKTR